MILFFWLVRVEREWLMFLCSDFMFRLFFGFFRELFGSILYMLDEVLLFFISGVFMEIWCFVLVSDCWILLVEYFRYLVSFLVFGGCLNCCFSLLYVWLILLIVLILFSGRCIIFVCLVNVCRMDCWIY